ncbi:MAG: hypothetical protein K6G13_06735 [Agathobacter sp.]|uniref:hypothetical protein n=1 Tax=Agathobacter sp. TaxID=2021311 RepID=UPI002584C401|nr:hypothetical protein [Agathobacter sp.]MCR5677707.1 hypothetical protein [Agathobacter sp.]
MTHNEEIEIVCEALRLEKEANNVIAEYYKVVDDTPPSIDPEPTKRVVQKKQYPVIKSTVKHNWAIMLVPTFILWLLGAMIFSVMFEIGVLISLLGWIWPIIYLVQNSKLKKQNIIDISNTEEYRAVCNEIDRKYEEECKMAETEYLNRMEDYKNNVVVQYNNMLQMWNAQHEKQLREVKNSKESAEHALEKFYTESRIIPEKYHDVEILEYIYKIISSSEYTIKECIDDYEKNEMKKLEMARIQELQYANALASNKRNWRKNRIAY